MKINEIFYSLQGEGHWSGTPMVFIRFAGCNLQCPFCDTDWVSFTEMDDSAILSAIAKYPSKRVCITGGEPCLQVTEAFLSILHQHGYTIHMESNGTIVPPAGVDWLTLSPKSPFLTDGQGCLAVKECQELKLLYPSNPSLFDDVKADYRFLQPIDEAGKTKENTIATIQYICDHPQWRLSVQMHKMLDIK